MAAVKQVGSAVPAPAMRPTKGCLREMLLSNADLARKLADLERKYDSQFKEVFDAIRQLMAPPPPPLKAEIG